jgi:Xaa-Pro dipeptidase
LPEPSPFALFSDHLQDITGRTAGALAASGHDGLLLQAGDPPPYFLDDQHYPFRAHPPFRLWVPLADAAGSFVYVEPGRRPRLVFYKANDFWHKPSELPDEPWVGAFDVAVVDSPAAARAALPASLARVAYVGQPFRELLGWGLGAINPQHLVHRLDFERARKTPYEIACLRDASRLGALGHRAAHAAFCARASEYTIHQAFLQACGQREHELPYNAIVALNEAAATLHYQRLERRAPDAHRLLLIDAGASVAGYGSDITRTWTADDADDFAPLVAGMERLQQRLCARVQPGVDWRDIHLAAVAEVAELLQASGIVRCTAAQAIDSGVAARFFPHGIGHLLGLQVHDVGGTQAAPTGGEIPRPPGHPALRLTRRLEPGFVVTMEPGLYFIDALLQPLRDGPHSALLDWGRIDALRPFGGIRIEDDLVVTATGCENLTRAAFAALPPA